MALVANNDTYIVLDINETSSYYAMTIRVMITKFVARARSCANYGTARFKICALLPRLTIV